MTERTPDHDAAEAAAIALHNLMRKHPAGYSMAPPWEYLPQEQREQTRLMVRTVLTAYGAATLAEQN